MVNRVFSAGVVVSVLVTVAASVGRGQTPGVPTAAGAQAAAADTVVLARRIALHLERVTLKQAVDAIASEGHLRIAYSRTEVPLDRLVSLVVDSITVGDALTVLLRGTGIAVSVSRGGWLVLDRVATPGGGGIAVTGTSQRIGGTITGTVTDSITGSTVPYVIVQLDEGVTTTASAQGRYALADVAAGEHRVTARRVGFIPKVRTVVVAEGAVATLDFRLNQPPTKLDEVVTTAVGDQRRYQVGNSIATIEVDSIAPTAPVTSVTDIISARAPGVEVIEANGMTGSGEAIRIRGQSSLVLQSNPIIIVDGVRQDNSPGGDLDALLVGPGSHTTPTRLNDLDFNDIASIDILKGPAASTEYGTDAANGVIVITTKHGVAGHPQWSASAEQTESDMPTTFPNKYYTYGHTLDGTNTPVQCPRFSLSGYTSAAGTCASDSVTQWNPLNHSSTSIFGTGTRGKYDLSVGGGSETTRYFLSGNITNETGLIHMPSVFKTLADTAHLGLPPSAFAPNGEQQRTVRANTSIRLGANADLNTTAAYLSTYQTTPEADALYTSVENSPGLDDAAHFYGYGHHGYFSPIAELSTIGSQNTDRLTGGMTATWRPAGWLITHATVGVDHGSQRSQAIVYPFSNPNFIWESGGSFFGVTDATTDVYSADLRATATAALTTGVRAVTSAGLQLADTRTAGQSASTTNISTTNLSLDGATTPLVNQVGIRQATLGGYGEEQLGFDERLFLTGAVRVDGASGFGRDYSVAIYPKASVSWLAISGDATTLRLRGAFGESGVQPTSGAALQLFQTGQGYIGGTTVSVNNLSWPGNPNLRPERSEEFEGGFDLGAWGSRLSLEFTGYSKTTRDALVNVSLGESLNNALYEENIGEVRNAGLEGTLSAMLVDSRSVSWNITLNASVNHNELVSLAPGVNAQTVFLTPFSQLRQAPGFPLYGAWAHKVTYADKNHDGILEPNEVTIADSASYIGSTIPTQEASFATHVGLLHGALTVGALVDYRGGFRVVNIDAFEGDATGNSRAANDPHAPLWQQARAIANSKFVPDNSLTDEDGTYVRFRELSLTYTIPRALIRVVRLQNLSLTAAVRNLALWTRFSGTDPEVSSTYGYNGQASPAGGFINNDVRAAYGAVPLARYFVLRLNAGF
jgi:TonB-linked SusC/RagA family outer membrane protein